MNAGSYQILHRSAVSGFSISGHQSHSHSHILLMQTRAQAKSLSMSPPPSDFGLSQIPFRARKIRKISSKTAGDKPPPILSSESVVTTVFTDPNPRNFPKSQNPLSATGEIDLALEHLRSSDPLLARLIDAYKPPSFDSSRPPFQSLAKSILYQQLATNAAKSIHARFLALCGGEDGVSPESVLALSAQQLREIGVSGRKAGYLHDLADKYRNGVLSDSSILEMDDAGLLTMLTIVKGIGVWSVHMFMIFSLHKPDVLPVGDLGVRKGVQLLYGLQGLPHPAEMESLCQKWKPYRSVGSWYMWRFMEAKGVLPNAQTSPTQQQ